jgi:hypothetical protein
VSKLDDELRAKQLAHPNRAGQAGRQHEFATFEHLFERITHLLDTGNPMATGEIEHRRIKKHTTAFRMPAIPA